MGATTVEPVAAWKVMLGGEDLTVTMKPRLISLKLDEATDEKADKLEIVLNDDDGQLAIPAEGALLTVALGWASGAGVTVGLISKGTFKVDDVSWYGPSDQISITAHSADLAGSFRQRKNKVWNGKTMSAIVSEVAANNGQTPACHPDLAAIVVTSVEQAHKSDMQLLRDLGRRYDAVATVKAGKLIFAPKGATTTVSGATIPTLTITRTKSDTVTWRRSAREGEQDGAEAQYFNQGTGKRVVVGAGGSNRKRMKRIYASQADAHAAATSESNRLARKKASFSLTLALGDATISAGKRAVVSGCKQGVDGANWLISSVTHQMNDKGGFTTDLELTVAN